MPGTAVNKMMLMRATRTLLDLLRPRAVLARTVATNAVRSRAFMVGACRATLRPNPSSALLSAPSGRNISASPPKLFAQEFRVCDMRCVSVATTALVLGLSTKCACARVRACVRVYVCVRARMLIVSFSSGMQPAVKKAFGRSKGESVVSG